MSDQAMQSVHCLLHHILHDAKSFQNKTQGLDDELQDQIKTSPLLCGKDIQQVRGVECRC